jgi:hypothetical protein
MPDGYVPVAREPRSSAELDRQPVALRDTLVADAESSRHFCLLSVADQRFNPRASFVPFVSSPVLPCS